MKYFLPMDFQHQGILRCEIMANTVAPWTLGKMDFEKRPLFVCWETTKACKLACRHCRAKAIRTPLPGELSHEDGLRLIDQVAEFGQPYPAILFTGGDPLMRQDFLGLMGHARDLGIYTAVAASVTDLLTESMLQSLKDLDVGAISISLDGADPETHDRIRGVPGTWERSIDFLKMAQSMGLKTQINTTVMKSNIGQLPEIFNIALTTGASAWEVFFLIRTGRGSLLENPEADDIEEVMKFLAVASRYGITVRTSEGAHFRRVIRQFNVTEDMEGNSLHGDLISKLIRLHGSPSHDEMLTRISSTRDGKGLMFVSHNGEITPSGFLPLKLGKFPEDSIVDAYRNNQVFRDLRDSSKLVGKCRDCEYRNVCGGSRSRAYAEMNDPFESDPLCTYQPLAYVR